jgi:hypothetical protein
MEQLPDSAEHGQGTTHAATHVPEESVSLVVWHNTTMLESDTVDGVPEGNILRSID